MAEEMDKTVPRISYAQNGEDVRLWRAFDSLPHGFYVEVGGWDPETDSISRSFYDRGWSGIVVEPVEEDAERYANARPRDRVVQCLAGERAGEAQFTVFPGTGLSTLIADHADRHASQGLEGRAEVLTVQRLDDILAELATTPTIHFMVIDVEGAEEAVLKGISFERYRPWVLVVESTEPRTAVVSKPWEPLILEKGYRAVAFDGLNTYYVSEEHAELGDCLASPPNPLDNFLTIHYHNALAQLGQGLAERDAAYRETRVLQARLELAMAQLKAARRNTVLAESDRDSHKRRALELEGELNAVRATTSWRITAPLRAVKSRL